jgi:hypothetical protein
MKFIFSCTSPVEYSPVVCLPRSIAARGFTFANEYATVEPQAARKNLRFLRKRRCEKRPYGGE